MDQLYRMSSWIDRVNSLVGSATAWLALALVLVQFVVVVLRFVFGIGFIPLQESVWYLHGILFMLGAGYTLMIEGHVRVDVFYREARTRTKALVDLFGTLFLLLPVMALILYLSASYVLDSWYNFQIGKWVLEGSTELSGLPLIFALKTVIWIFAGLLALQGISMAVKAGAYLTGHIDSYPVKPDDLAAANAQSDVGAGAG